MINKRKANPFRDQKTSDDFQKNDEALKRGQIFLMFERFLQESMNQEEEQKKEKLKPPIILP